MLVATDNAAAGPAIDAMREAAQERGSLRLRVAAEWYAADLALRTGRVAEAERLARLALDLVDSDRNVLSDGVVEVLVCALAERGAFDEARELLRERDLDHARARLSLAEGDFERAYAAAHPARRAAARAGPAEPVAAAVAVARRAGARSPRAPGGGSSAWPTPSWRWPSASVRRCRSPARCTPARSPSPMSPTRDRALRTGADGRRGRAVRARSDRPAARARRGPGVLAAGASTPGRRCGTALAAAEDAGAVLLARRARRELAATGLRSRPAAHEGAAALTPRQRQICELAAAGKGNRAIAQELFLSIKTIETHLAAAYRKLGVANRGELAAELAA